MSSVTGVATGFGNVLWIVVIFNEIVATHHIAFEVNVSVVGAGVDHGNRDFAGALT